VCERGCGIKDAAGNVVALEGFITDITDRKRMEESLQRSEQHYRSTVSALIEGVIVFDSQGRALTCNPSAERILGLTLDQIQREKRSLADWNVLHEDLSPFPTDQLPLARALATSQSQRGVIFGHRRPDGEVRWLLVNAEPVFDPLAGRAGSVVVSFTDITERISAETALRENEERLRLALSAANQGFYDVDVRTGEVVVSPEYARMLGFEPEEFHETEAAWRQRLHPEDREQACRAYEEYLAGRRSHYRVEFRLRTKSGQYRWILSVGKVVARDAEGRPVRMLGTHTDITDRKQAEARLAEQVRELQRWHDATLGAKSASLS
jgi:PAS domain S-box-containing protein